MASKTRGKNLPYLNISMVHALRLKKSILRGKSHPHVKQKQTVYVEFYITSSMQRVQCISIFMYPPKI